MGLQLKMIRHQNFTKLSTRCFFPNQNLHPVPNKAKERAEKQRRPSQLTPVIFKVKIEFSNTYNSSIMNRSESSEITRTKNNIYSLSESI